MKLTALISKKKTGDDAESLALSYLQDRGLMLVMQNYRCRFGEIDLIMQHRETLVFVEVRYRASTSYGGAAASIHVAKQRRIIAAATHYLSTLRTVPPCRFDAILMNKLDNAHVEWLQSAFDAG
jgi:putative endonuclease